MHGKHIYTFQPSFDFHGIQVVVPEEVGVNTSTDTAEFLYLAADPGINANRSHKSHPYDTQGMRLNIMAFEEKPELVDGLWSSDAPFAHLGSIREKDINVPWEESVMEIPWSANSEDPEYVLMTGHRVLLSNALLSKIVRDLDGIHTGDVKGRSVVDVLRDIENQLMDKQPESDQVH